MAGSKRLGKLVRLQHLREEVAAVLVDIEGRCESFAISSHVSLSIMGRYS